MKLNTYASVEEVLHQMAAYIVAAANESIAARGTFTIALSGGSSPRELYKLLASPVYNQLVDWNKAWFFFGDERYVPMTDAASNYRMVDQVFFTPLQVAPSHVFPVDTARSPEAAANDYMQAITTHFDGGIPSFDLVLLGLGDNSHTASLFPHTDILHETSATVKAVWLHEQQVYRISFTAPLINMARRVAYLVYGEGKAQAVANILEGAHDIENFPAQLIQPEPGELEWFLDQPAASKLKTG
jgi:6-phosphogluconolactonase